MNAMVGGEPLDTMHSHMSYEVKTRVFEGPLDLLLQLITSHQLEITELSLASIVTEYLAYLDAMRQLDIDVTSEFLLIAATLIQLKARRLLPGESAFDLDEELALAEERDRLLARLLACLTFKDVAAVMAHRFESADRFVPRQAGLDPGIEPRLPDVPLMVTPSELALIAERALNRRDEEVELDHLEFDLPSVDAALADVRRRLVAGAAEDFDELVAHCARPLEVVAYFLAVLELARWGILRLSQEGREGPITVTHNAGVDESDFEAIQSEWGTA
jgi:segregation and condensation protein A